jgi:hypothetical protein
MSDFETWWYHEGSGPPLPGEDCEEHCKRMCEIAWSNGAFKAALVRADEREACARLAYEWSRRPDDVGGYIARNIQARGNK